MAHASTAAPGRAEFDEIRAFLQTKTEVKPRVGIVCGSGLGNLVKAVTSPSVISYSEIPHFPGTSVKGHAGELVFGLIGETPVMLMRGRFHFYEGHDAKTVRPRGRRCSHSWRRDHRGTRRASGPPAPRCRFRRR